MTVKRYDVFASRRTDLEVKVVSVKRKTFGDDYCRIVDFVDGKTVKDSGRYVFADSLRRRYFKV